MKVRTLLYIMIGVPVFFSLVWLFAVPTGLIQEKIEEAVASSGTGELHLSVTGLRKGLLLDLYADSIALLFEGKPAIEIVDFKINLTPRYLSDFRIAAAVNGTMGGGKVYGSVRFPLDGTLHIDGAALNDIPYLKRTGIDINGTLSSEVTLKGDTVTAVFSIPDLSVGDSAVTIIPLVNSFRTMQGSLTLRRNNLNVDSVSIDGEKGYARLKGAVTNGVMDLSLELMPEESKLNAMESMLIGKYIVSPGYYVVPVKGPLP